MIHWRALDKLVSIRTALAFAGPGGGDNISSATFQTRRKISFLPCNGISPQLRAKTRGMSLAGSNLRVNMIVHSVENQI